MKYFESQIVGSMSKSSTVKSSTVKSSTVDVSFVKGLLRNLFRERQIYMQADGKIRYLPLKSYVQVVLFLFAFVVLGTGVYTVFNIFDKNRIISSNSQKYYDMKGNYERRITGLGNKLKALNEKVRNERKLYSGHIIDITQMYEVIESRNKGLKLILGDGDIFNDGEQQEKFTEDYSTQSITELAREVELAITQAQQNIIFIEETKVNRSGLLPRYFGEQESAQQLVYNKAPRKIKEKMREYSRVLEGKLKIVRKEQINIAKSFIKKIDDKLERYSIALENIGLEKDARKIIESAGVNKIRNKNDLVSGTGGPYIAVSYSLKGTQNQRESQIIKEEVTFRDLAEQLRQYASTLKTLKEFSKQIPIKEPLAVKSYVSSGFGYRRDPFNRRRAMHSGIDYAAKMGTHVRATADGVVTKLKYAGSYGLMVEVEHVNGMATRYAHLSKTFVRKGQKVKYNQILALVGSTGRSTGPHLHYEIRKLGKPVDPGRYLKAGKYVQ